MVINRDIARHCAVIKKVVRMIFASSRPCFCSQVIVLGGTPTLVSEVHGWLSACRLVRSLLEDKPRVTRFPIEWDELPQSIPTIGNENQPPVVNQADHIMQDDYAFQKPLNTADVFGQPSNQFNQSLSHGDTGFGGFQTAQHEVVDHGSMMEE